MLQPGKLDYMVRGARTGSRIGMAAGGAALGAAGFIPKTYEDPNTGKTKERTTGQRIAGGLLGAGWGTLLGHMAGSGIGGIVNHNRWDRGLRPGIPKWMTKAKDRVDLRNRFAQELERAGDDISKQRVKNDMQKFRGGFKAPELNKKAAMLEAFADELTKIAQDKQASLGAILGGAAGYKISPNSLKGKAMGVLGGAAVGAGLEGAAKKSKQWFWDEPRAREQAQLYGYVPAASQMDIQGSNFY